MHPREITVNEESANDLGYIQRINHAVAERLFPHRTSTTMFLKLYEEIGELVSNPDSGEELADIAIMILDHAERINYNLGRGVLEKLQKNLQRKWVMDIRTGIFSHEER